MVDQYSPLNHRAGMGDDAEGGDFDIATYYSDEQVRRLKAYIIQQAMMETIGRDYLVPPEDVADVDEWRAEWRELGDVSVYVDRVAAAVLGEEPSVGVVGADDQIPDRVVLPDRPRRPSEDDPDLDPAIAAAEDVAYQAEVEVYALAVEEATERWLAQQDEQVRLTVRQDLIREWADDAQYIAQCLASELEWTVPLGDSVRVFGWDPETGAPSMEVYEPHTYMPVLDDVRASADPNRLHLLWEYNDPADEEDKVRRMTWELLPVDPKHPRYEAIDLGQVPRYTETATWRYSCVFTDVTVLKDQFEGPDEPVASGEFAEVLVPGQTEPIPANRIPIGLDEIPVTHYTNDLVAGDRHFGRGLFVRAAQLLDELAGTDTDESLASQWAARPPVAMSGLPPNVETIDLTPGQGVAISNDGRLFVVDMANNLPAVGARKADLRRSLSVALQVPEGLVGRVDASDVPSGVAFTLSFTSFQQLIGRMRMVRAPKYRKDLRLVQKIAIQNQAEGWDDVQLYEGELRPGSFMPQDLAALASILKTLRDAGLISIATGVAELQDVGINSGSVENEVDLIRAGQTTEALEVADATGSAQLAAEWLRLTLPADAGEDDEDDGGGAEAGGNTALPPGGNTVVDLG